ncbi:MAG TPA: tRNA (adenosine(37)-N6)-dimethylallyltransferase MiaA [Candidatus Acidoferrales bacterium]|jgi:tRNA dimethylallyltransferase
MGAPPLLVVILGPTASGKSTLGMRLAQETGGEILVCDSTQVYRYFDIGTAKASAAERQGVPHHLVDLVEPEEVFTAGDFRRCAVAVLDDLRQRKVLPILTAGTGLYLRALLEGLSDAPGRSEELRARLREKAVRRGPQHLHRILSKLDAETARRIAPRDTQKIIRAIEMRMLAGKPISEIHAAGRSPLEGYTVKKIGLLPPRPALYTRIHARTAAMLESGWAEEARGLMARHISAHAKPFQFIGYPEMLAHIEGRLPLEDAARQIEQATRRYAKRQITWFRKELGVEWVHAFGDSQEAFSAALRLVRE